MEGGWGQRGTVITDSPDPSSDFQMEDGEKPPKKKPLKTSEKQKLKMNFTALQKAVILFPLLIFWGWEPFRKNIINWGRADSKQAISN